MIDGIIFKQMVISAANNIDNKKQSINDLNVFPVPDGDTGTNMSMTICAARAELEKINSDEIGVVSDKVATALLKGARGNSGVILSLLFRGFSKELKGVKSVDSIGFANALNSGVKAAYGAVMKPTEGTILTVARVAAQKALENANKITDTTKLFELVYNTASETLDKTPEMLPVLKQAKVVDAGGKGLLEIYFGMLSFLRDGVVIEAQEASEQTVQKADFQSFNTEDIKFAYCTEFLIEKSESANAESFKKFLYTIGDSVVAVDDTDIIKVHVHTNNPGKVLEEALKNGSLIKIKIENMKEQHSEQASGQAETQADTTEDEVAQAEKTFGFVSVCAGEGLSVVFSDLGVDKIVEGGQTMNPSTDDLIKAINSVPAEIVFVLPNNKNIIMAASQAAEIAQKEVVVIPSKTIPQGITSMLEFNPDASKEENSQAMMAACEKVKTGQITFAARDSEFDGHQIKEGEILGLIENKVTFVEKDIDICIDKVAAELTKDGAGYVTLFYGSDVNEEQAEAVNERLINSLNCDINTINGGQPIYYYIISAE
ncbi:MAG: DAK2 domain-containing protein [Ruminococcaceae bacterium]|nr:DAK2 domain-containing protein [Oscillospiraceae bacterium]